MHCVLSVARAGLVGLSVLSVWGCAARGPTSQAIAAEQLAGFAPRDSSPIFNGAHGSAVSWEFMLAQLAQADVVVIGEQHDDAFGHRVQLAIVQDMTATYEHTALAMEMLDRNEQATIDDYLAGMVTHDQFIERVASTTWYTHSQAFFNGQIDAHEFTDKMHRLGWPDWLGNYQPIIDAAKTNGASVIGANTPWALYTRLAGKEGYAALGELTDAQRALFDLPHAIAHGVSSDIDTGDYRARFWQIMAGRAEGEPAEDVQTAHGVHPGMTDQRIEGMFHSQLLMDATMAGSIADALDRGELRVIHLVGQFHSDFHGGTVQEILHRKPGANVMTISLRRWDPQLQFQGRFALQPDDTDRADFVIYTSPASPASAASPAH